VAGDLGRRSSAAQQGAKILITDLRDGSAVPFARER